MARALLAGILLVLLAVVPAAAIVGGRPATEPYPFMASLEYEGEHICGASLLAPDRVLTAAHCVSGERAESFSVVLGRTDLTTDAGQEHDVAGIDVHPDYSDDGFGFDVAILRLERPSSQAPTRLATPGERRLWAPGSEARVLGWGTSFFLLGGSPDRLHEVDVPIVEDDDCERLNDREFDRRTMVCAGEDEGLKDSCQGDSGGPLLVRAGGGWAQVGTVSLGMGCGLPLFYGVYARVAADPLRGWILEHAGLDDGTGGSPPAPTPTPTPTATPTPTPSPPAGPRLSVGRDLGTARAARRRGALRLSVRATAPVRSVRAVLRRSGRVVARGRRDQLEGRGRVRLPVRRVRPGRMRATVTAMAADGSTIRTRALVRVRR